MTTDATLAERLSPTHTQIPINNARITQVNVKERGRLSPARAMAPWAFNTATQAKSCNRFNTAKNLDP